MDTLTHALSGALLARATAPAASAISVRARVTAGVFAAAFPDIDFVVSFVSPAAYLVGHRSLTHSVFLLPLWALLLAWVFSRFGRHRNARPRDFLFIAAAGIAIHILGDLITSFGTILFSPFSDLRAAWSTTFIIDLWFSGIIIVGLVASLIWRRSRIPAVASLAVLTAYVGFQAVLHDQAIDVGREYAAKQGLKATRVAALPQPVSPFNWLVMVEADDHYHAARVKLHASALEEPREAPTSFLGRIDAAYAPVSTVRWNVIARFGREGIESPLAKEAFAAPDLAFFRWFADFPALLRMERGNPSTCVWFEDVRFAVPGRDGMPFQFGVCREGEGPWRAYELRDGRRVPAHRGP